MFDKTCLGNCFCIIVFSTDCNTLTTFIDNKSVEFVILEISNLFLGSCIPLCELTNRIKTRHISHYFKE